MYRIIIMLLTAALFTLPLAGCGGGGGKKAEPKAEETSVLEEGSETMHEAEHPTGEAGSETQGQEHPTSEKTEGSETQ